MTIIILGEGAYYQELPNAILRNAHRYCTYLSSTELLLVYEQNEVSQEVT